MKQFLHESLLSVLFMVVAFFLGTRGCDWIESFGEEERARQSALWEAERKAEQKELFGSDEERQRGTWTAMSLYSAFENNPGRLVTTLGNKSFVLRGIVHDFSTKYVGDSLTEYRSVELKGMRGNIWAETVSVVGIPNGLMPSKGSTFNGTVRLITGELDSPVCLYRVREFGK